MRQALKTMSMLAFSRAIAEKAIENLDPDKHIERRLYRSMANESMNALTTWPDKIKRKDVADIHKHIDTFCKTIGWDSRGRSIQTYLNFSLTLLERLKENISDQTRINAIDKLIESLMAVYRHFAWENGNREYPLCFRAGTKAQMIWDAIMDDLVVDIAAIEKRVDEVMK